MKKKVLTADWSEEVKDKWEVVDNILLQADDNIIARISRFKKLDIWKQDLVYLYSKYQNYRSVGEIMKISYVTVMNYYKDIMKELTNK